MADKTWMLSLKKTNKDLYHAKYLSKQQIEILEIKSQISHPLLCYEIFWCVVVFLFFHWLRQKDKKDSGQISHQFYNNEILDSSQISYQIDNYEIWNDPFIQSSIKSI